MTSKTAFAFLFAAFILASPALAQQKPIRIAVVDTSRVFNEMQETADLRKRMEAERQRLQATLEQKRAEIKTLQGQRELLKPDHPQFEELNKQMLQKAMEMEVWEKYTKIDAERSQKRQMRDLFSKIEDAVADVATKQGLDLVLNDQRPDIPDMIDAISMDQLRAVINSRQVLFAARNIDISNDVIATLDAQYKGDGGAARAPADRSGATPAKAGTK